ncbi:MAG TPA: cytochrome C oxidase subunit I, partial [Parafilimonas sp.]|nr:cytochrome C oxidase subunit I [Parafilimonas sp.]
MFAPSANIAQVKTTSYKVALPFYLYAAVSFLAATLLLFTSSSTFLIHYFQPHVLAITHIMALGWGTMIILGASHQLVPVIIEGKLYSNALAHISFFLAAVGIPLLAYSFYIFNMGELARCGGVLVLLSILAYIINLSVSILKSKSENVHAIFVLTAAAWLLFTASLGLTLVYNFTLPLLSHDSVHYLPLHAHAGIIGWFLLLVIGVASRLIPMFLISKYNNVKLLWWIYFFINAALILYIILFYFSGNESFTLLPALMLLAAIMLFIFFCYKAMRQRLRRQIDEQIKTSLLSVVIMIVPVFLLAAIIISLAFISKQNIRLVLSYGFLIFFGWLTAMILGMTFKTLPFIVWNKVYHHA